MAPGLKRISAICNGVDAKSTEWKQSTFKGKESISLRKENYLIEFRNQSQLEQGGHGTGKTGNLDVHFSRQGKHREFAKKY